MLRGYAEQIVAVQERNRTDGEPPRRGFHAKQVVGITGARLVVADDVPDDLRCRLFEPGRAHPATIRLSNASGVVQDDGRPDLRGIAVRVFLPDGALQDILCTNAPASHARDAHQFMATAVAMAGGRKLLALPGLVRRVGLREGVRIIRVLRRDASRPVASLATESFWTRTPFAIGPLAVKLTLEPLAGPGDGARPGTLRDELRDRLRGGEVRYRLRVLRFVDEATTPIEDGTVRWPEPDPPAGTVAELVIPPTDLDSPACREADREVDALAFTPWHEEGGLHPIGGLNRARRPVYEASARHRAEPKG